jgi:hypothetical protein
MKSSRPVFRKVISGLIAVALALSAARLAIAAPPAAAVFGNDVPLTGGDADQRGVIPPDYDPIPSGIYKDPGDQAVPPDPSDSPAAEVSTDHMPSMLDGIGRPHKDAAWHGPTPGETAYNHTHDASSANPLTWSVTVRKQTHQLVIYYKGLWFGTYRAVFGRNLDQDAKSFEGDRQTPEGVYMIVERHPSRRWRYFLTLNYPNLVDRIRYEELRDSQELPIDEGTQAGVGGRIGIHGTDNPILNSGNINWTTGCISIDNDAVTRLYRILPTGTLVIIKP